MTIETPNDIATQVLNVVFYELPVEEIGTFRERVQAVTPDDIQRVAKQHVRPDRLSIVLVGDASSFVPQLRKVGFPDVEVIPINELDLMSATLRRDAPRARGRPSRRHRWGISDSSVLARRRIRIRRSIHDRAHQTSLPIRMP